MLSIYGLLGFESYYLQVLLRRAYLWEKLLLDRMIVKGKNGSQVPL